MGVIKERRRIKPRVSLVLLDWSVRESFHLFHYLSLQTIERDDFEVVVIEFYDRVSESIEKFSDQVDTWFVLDMPPQCYYHKHLMYNVGISVARGDIVMIGDSDAMVRPNFIETIISAFDRDPEIVFHIDQFRNVRRDLYPFCYPTFEEVLGEGCINNVGGKTAGVLNEDDPIHSRNYGACMCAKRQDLIAIGGADEHIDYLGHICGPYDMTFRLVNLGRREIWSHEEFMYHTWHPGQAGADNFMGPHDGRHMSTTALEALSTRRTLPLHENRVLHAWRQGRSMRPDEVMSKLIDPRYFDDWDIERIRSSGDHLQWNDYKRPMGTYLGFRLVAEVDRVFAYPATDEEAETRPGQGHAATLEGADVVKTKRRIDASAPPTLRTIQRVAQGASIVRYFATALARRRPVAALPRPLRFGVALGLLPVAILGLAVARPAFLRAKVRDVAHEVRNRASAPGNIALTLSNLFRCGELPKARRLPVVVVGTQWAARGLRLVGWLKLTPPFIACSVEDIGRQVSEQRRPDDATETPMIVPADILMRAQAVLNEDMRNVRLVVV